jgi:mono/diheme cytochrome c family protein
LRTTTEAALALVIVLVLGAGFWFYGGGELGGDGSSETTTTIVVDPEAAGRGLQLANDNGCLACHTVDGTPSAGPTWSGVAGASVDLESGETVIADTAYLFNSIVDPGAQVVAGFADTMPSEYVDQLTEAEINDLVSYIQSLAG